MVGSTSHKVMPTYEYACTNCGRHLEIVQSFADDPLEICEVCGGKLRRVFHPVGVLFKGSGFYRTDAGMNSSKRTSEKSTEKSGEPSTDGKKTDKQETKPEASKSSKSESKAEEKSA